MSCESNERPQCKSVNTLFSYDTEYSADSIEWCPHVPWQNFFVCGNYQLAALDDNDVKDENKSKRLGRILLFAISSDGLNLYQTINTAAVLDLKWCHVKINNQVLLGAVNAAKTLEIYALNVESKKLDSITKHVLEASDDLLILSLDWSTGKYVNNEPNIVTSDSKGNINLFKLLENNLVLLNKWHAHDYEAWITAFYYWDTNIIFSGGDDSILLKFDMRIGTESVLKNKSHTAGVTCFHSNTKREFICASGSYDSFVRFWDIRTTKMPLNQFETPGTLWRLKWDPFSYDYLLAACMLGGAHIIAAKSIENVEITDSYYEHKDITYGSDWCYLNEDDVRKYECNGNRIIGTCSFYDHLLCVSKLTITE